MGTCLSVAAPIKPLFSSTICLLVSQSSLFCSFGLAHPFTETLHALLLYEGRYPDCASVDSKVLSDVEQFRLICFKAAK